MPSHPTARDPVSKAELQHWHRLQKFGLGKVEKMIVLLRIHEELTLDEIAKFLQITRTRLNELVRSMMCRAKAAEIERRKLMRIAARDRREQDKKKCLRSAKA